MVQHPKINHLASATLAFLFMGNALNTALAQTYDQTIGINQTSTVTLVKPGITVLVDAGVTIIPTTGNGITGQVGDIWSITNFGTITATSGGGIELQATGSVVTNNGAINSSSFGVYSSYGLTVINNAGASIVSSSYGIYNSVPNEGPGVVIENSGLLQGSFSAVNLSTGANSVATNTIHNYSGGQIVTVGANSNAITILHASTILTNDAGGTIQGTQSAVSGNDLFTELIVDNAGSILGGTGAAIWSYGGGPITNRVGGTISGAGGIAYVRSRFNDTDILTNAGTIRGTGTTFVAGNSATAGSGAGVYFGGVYAPVGGFVNNLASGRIEGVVYGIYSGAASLADDAGPITVTNAGTIIGQTGVSLNGANGTIINSGVITGTGGTAIAFDQIGLFHNSLTLDTGSVLGGLALGGPGPDDVILKGTNSEDVSKLRNMETLSMVGMDWTLTGNGAFSTSADIVSGVLRVNGTLSSPAVTVQAAATLAGTGTVVGDIVNSGTIAPGNNGIGTFTINGNYLGNNGMLIIKSVLGNDDSVSDKLIIDSGAATGSTTIRVVNLNGAGALTTSEGIPVVETARGGTTAVDAFHLSGRVAAGAYEYTLHRGGEASPDDWYLRSVLQIPPEPDEPDVIEVPNYRVEVPLVTAITPIAMEYGYAMLGTLHERVGEVRNSTIAPAYEEQVVRYANGGTQIARAPVAATAVDHNKWFSGAWGRAIGDRGFRDNGNFQRRGPDYDYTFAGIQAGLDVYGREKTEGARDKAGIYVGYGQIDANVKGAYSGRAGSIDIDAYTLGAYWTHVAAQGWYTDAVIQGTWYAADARSIEGQRVKPDGFGFIASLEGGYAFDLGNSFSIEPQVQFAYQNVSFDDVSDAYGHFSLSDGESLRGRLGARLVKTWNVGDTSKPRLLDMWLRTNIWHEFMGEATTTISFLPFTSSLGGTWGEIGAGVSGQVSDHMALFATGGYNRSLDNKGRESWNGRLGATINW